MTTKGEKEKCNYCGKRNAVGQTAKGKYAEEMGHQPQNFGYYCKKCYEEGIKLENEAMYGN